jgi:multicomponent Na+:H+ antiporter subunit C
MVIYILCIMLLLVGVYGMIVKRDLIKIILASGITGYAANLLLVLVGYRKDASYPIITANMPVKTMVDPLPQALVLTSIVIELGLTALLVALAIRLYEKYRSFDITKIRRLKG